MAVQLILKNSTVEDRRPTGAQLANGELSLNYNEAGPFLCCKDTAGNIQQLGGIKFNPDVPADAVIGTWWYNTATETLYVWDGTIWREIAGGGGGGGSGITQILGDDGIDVTVIGSTVTLNVDINRNKGLDFEADQLVINPGANISFDADGKLQADIDTLSYKGTVDLTSDPVPSAGSAGDAFVNIGPGAMTAAWQIATGLGATTVSPGDLVVKSPTAWSYIPTGGVDVQTDLGIDNRGIETLDITSSTGTDVTIPAATDALAGLMTAADKATLDAGGTPSGDTGDRPTSPEIGDLYFDTDLELLLVWNGTSWEPVSPPTVPGQWQRNGTKLTPSNGGDTVAVTAADGTENIVLKPGGILQAESVWVSSPTGADPSSGANAGTRLFSKGNFISSGTSGTRSEWWVTGDSVANIYIRNDGELQIKGNPNGGIADGLQMNPSLYYQASASAGTKALYRGYKTGDSNPTFTVTANGNGEFAGDVTINGDIINAVTDGDQDIICDGSGLTKLTEYNLSPMEVVTKHDIGTRANEVPLNGFLGTLAYKDAIAIQDGTTVALLPTSPTARVGDITRVTDGAAALTWGATVTGGGTAQYLVWYNGTNWTVFGA
jgi:hypothetical protein